MIKRSMKRWLSSGDGFCCPENLVIVGLMNDHHLWSRTKKSFENSAQNSNGHNNRNRKVIVLVHFAHGVFLLARPKAVSYQCHFSQKFELIVYDRTWAHPLKCTSSTRNILVTAKLSGSSIFLLFPSLDPILVHFGALWGLVGPSWVLSGIPHGSLGVILGWHHLGGLGRPFGPSWNHLEPSWPHPGLLLAPLGSVLPVTPGAHMLPIWVPQGPFSHSFETPL